jgi:hypothetical protein
MERKNMILTSTRAEPADILNIPKIRSQPPLIALKNFNETKFVVLTQPRMDLEEYG